MRKIHVSVDDTEFACSAIAIMELPVRRLSDAIYATLCADHEKTHTIGFTISVGENSVKGIRRSGFGASAENATDRLRRLLCGCDPEISTEPVADVS